jgi:hypothetical protein
MYWILLVAVAVPCSENQEEDVGILREAFQDRGVDADGCKVDHPMHSDRCLGRIHCNLVDRVAPGIDLPVVDDMDHLDDPHARKLLDDRREGSHLHRDGNLEGHHRNNRVDTLHGWDREVAIHASVDALGHCSRLEDHPCQVVETRVAEKLHFLLVVDLRKDVEG